MKIKALYKISELAEMADIPERTMRRWVLAQQIEMRVGKSYRVPLFRFQDAFPEAWSAIRLKYSLIGAKSKCPACNGDVTA